MNILSDVLYRIQRPETKVKLPQSGRMLLALHARGGHVYDGGPTYGRQADGLPGGIERVPVLERQSTRKRRTRNRLAKATRQAQRRR